jgi:divalent metal cation (Fe/Co/Zn/Cd) transporter
MSTAGASPILQEQEAAHTHGASCSHTSVSTNRTVKRLQVLTICWMLIECSVALTAAWRAHSPALLAFGSDSSVELLSAIVVLLQFTSTFKVSTERAARVAGILLYLLAGIVAVISVSALVLKIEPDTSKLGIGVTMIALTIMPFLSRAKRKNANLLGNRALAADAVQSATCAYLAGLTLLGLILNATLHIRWVDPLAALIAIPIIVIEARRALRGEVCC